MKRIKRWVFVGNDKDSMVCFYLLSRLLCEDFGLKNEKFVEYAYAYSYSYVCAVLKQPILG